MLITGLNHLNQSHAIILRTLSKSCGGPTQIGGHLAIAKDVDHLLENIYIYIGCSRCWPRLDTHIFELGNVHEGSTQIGECLGSLAVDVSYGLPKCFDYTKLPDW